MRQKATRKLLVVFISCAVLIAVYSVPVSGAESLLVLDDKDSYDFSANVRGELTGGDLYYGVYEGIGGFWANNLGQRGIQDVGDIGEVPLDEVAIPNENSQFGVPAVLGSHVRFTGARRRRRARHRI